MSLLISVVICTYNRANLLAGALESLCEQTLDSSEYDVIVVDNNSTDNTRAVTESFADSGLNVTYSFESQQGNSIARNHGWQKAKGVYVAFIDDDCKVPPEWLAIAKEIINQLSPSVFGGPYFAFYNSPKAKWFKDSYGSYELNHKEGVLEHPEYLAAGNLFMRREVLEKSGGFDTNFGIAGKKRGYGEETALLLHIIQTMPKARFHYDPKLLVYHLVRPEKMKIWWNIRAYFMRGRDGCRIYELDRISLFSLPFRLIRPTFVLLFIFLYGPFLRDKSKYPYFQSYFYEHGIDYFTTFGWLYERLKQSLTSK